MKKNTRWMVPPSWIGVVVVVVVVVVVSGEWVKVDIGSTVF